MTTQKLNDREEQVAIAALFYFLQHINFWSQGKKYHHLNEHDILAPGHSKAHIITAIQKLSGVPISHAFQNPHSTHLELQTQKQQKAVKEIRELLTFRVGVGKADELLDLATLQK